MRGNFMESCCSGRCRRGTCADVHRRCEKHYVNCFIVGISDSSNRRIASDRQWVHAGRRGEGKGEERAGVIMCLGEGPMCRCASVADALITDTDTFVYRSETYD